MGKKKTSPKTSRGRDNFPLAVIRTMRDRVAHRCSNPDCRVPTSSPGETSNKASSVGEAAHIEAAAKGGKRYNPNQTPEERKSIHNGIWLCKICARKIDLDEISYPVELLHRWKQQAEEAATRELGKVLPAEGDAMETLMAAMGAGGMKKPLNSAIGNVHAAMNQSLEALDPRFAVESAFENGVTKINIRAREQAEVLLNVSPEAADVFQRGFEGLINHARPFTVPANCISPEGSALFSHVFEDSAQFSVLPNSRAAKQRLWLSDPATGLVENFDEVNGQLYVGKQSFRFEGFAYEGIFSCKYDASFKDSKTGTIDITLLLDYQQWQGNDIRHLPYLKRLGTLLECMDLKWEVQTSLEVQGDPLIASNRTDFKDSDFLEYNAGLVYYTNRCANIARYFDLSIPFDEGCSFTEQEHKDVALASITCSGQNRGDFKKGGTPPTSTITQMPKYILKQLIAVDQPMDFETQSSPPQEVVLFGTRFVLPGKITSVRNVIPRFNVDPETHSPENEVKVVWELTPDSSWECRYVDDAKAEEKTNKKAGS